MYVYGDECTRDERRKARVALTGHIVSAIKDGSSDAEIIQLCMDPQFGSLPDMGTMLDVLRENDRRDLKERVQQLWDQRV